MKNLELSSISAVHIENLEKEDFLLTSSKSDTIDGISFINILIGENSSGKSRLLRKIFTTPVNYINVNSDLKSRIEAYLNGNDFSSFTFDNDVTAFLQEISLNPFDSKLNDIFLDTVRTICREIQNGQNEAHIQAIASKILPKYLIDELSNLQNSCTDTLKILQKKEYLPILRGLRPLDPKKDLFKERIFNDYFFSDKGGKDYEIFTGYSLYSDLTLSLLGLEEERESVKLFEVYLSKYFFEGKAVTLIPKMDKEGTAKPNDVVFVKVGDEPMRPIYELGDGIQAIIILTVRPFLAKEPTVFFIEEPEQHLHAGMQRALIQAFRACPQHKYFFTTQSNHFIDLSLESDDISLFSVKKVMEEGKTKSQVSNQHDRSEILKDLGVLASSVLLANCSIWVEGVTDKLYLRVYLQRFLNDLQKSSPEDIERYEKLSSFNENLHYVFVEYQGSNITHWNFSESTELDEEAPANKLNNNIFLIADQDISTKGSRVGDLEQALGSNFHLLDWKEIENYIPQKIVLKTAKQLWKSFNGKGDSELGLESIRGNAFENAKTGIGDTLEKKVKRVGIVKADRKFFRDTSGTIKDKMKFCRTACDLMDDNNSWELTPQLEELCDKIWLFIEEHNQI
jgi:hypothetical protein